MWAKFFGLISWRKLPGHAIWLLGCVWRLADYLGRVDMLSRVTEALGGTPAVIASIILSPWTSTALVLLGLSYVLFIGEPKQGVQRHQFWPYVGWTIFAVTLLAMVAVPVYGALEIYIRTQIDKGIAGLPRGGPDDNSPNRPQLPLISDTTTLQPDQIRILILELSKERADLPRLTLCRPFNIPETYNLWLQLDTVFTRSGLHPGNCNLLPNGPEEEGIILEIPDLSNISYSAQKMREAFEIANVPFKLIKMSPEAIAQFGPSLQFLIFVGPPPIRWR